MLAPPYGIEGSTGPAPQNLISKKKLKATYFTTEPRRLTGGGRKWHGGGIGMWNLYTKPVSVKKELQLTTEPKDWQGQRIGEVCKGECSKRRQDTMKQRQTAYIRNKSNKQSHKKPQKGEIKDIYKYQARQK